MQEDVPAVPSTALLKEPEALVRDLDNMGFCVTRGEEVLTVLQNWGGAKGMADEMAGLSPDSLESIFQDFKMSGGILQPVTQHDQRRMLMLSQNGKEILGLNDLDKRIRSVSDIVYIVMSVNERG